MWAGEQPMDEKEVPYSQNHQDSTIFIPQDCWFKGEMYSSI